MKFKHTFNVFIDNFSVTYKQLLYRLIIVLISASISFAVIYPLIFDLIKSPQLKLLLDNVKDFALNLLNGNVLELGNISIQVKEAFGAFIELVKTKYVGFILSALLILLVHIVAKWFEGLGNYATAAVINDRMALRANSPFLVTLIRNLKNAAIYNAIYVPLSILYDIVVGVAMFFLLFFLLNHILYFLVCVFLFVLAITFSIVIKMTFTTDWLPALIRGKKGHREALHCSFSRKNKGTLNILSNFSVLVLIIFALNSAAIILTLGVGLLLTIPSSYVILICFEFVNYYDREGNKYFIDESTIISTKKESPPSREEFFRGDDSAE